MQIYSLILFLAVVDFGSFSQAAVEKNISQSSLSKQIKGLEDEFHVKFFNRTSHHIKLTEEGAVFVSFAEKIVGDYHALCNTMAQYDGSGKGIIRIAASPVLHLYGLSDLIRDFRQKNPDTRMQITESPMVSIVQEIKRQSVDLAIVRSTIFPHREKGNYTFHHLVDDEMVFVCSKNHRLADVGEICVEEFNKECFALLKPGIFEYTEGLRVLGLDFDLEKGNILLHNVYTLADYIRGNEYVSLLMGGMADQICSDGDLVSRPIAEHPKFPLAIAVDNRSTSKIAKQFIEFATAFYKGK